MKRLGAYEAKTHLSRLLDEVEAGQQFAITKHGRTVALLVPAEPARNELTVKDAIEGLQTFRRGRKLATSVRRLIEDGRRR